MNFGIQVKIFFIMTSSILAILLLALVVLLIFVKIRNTIIINKGEVVYPTKLFDEVEQMKKDGVIRLYSKGINKFLYAISTSEISEEYKDGKFVSYADKTTKELPTSKMSFKEFLSKIPEIKVKSILSVKPGCRIRVEIDAKNLRAEAPINHYSAIGFEVNSIYQSMRIFERFKSSTQNVVEKQVFDEENGKSTYRLHKVGDIRYCYKIRENGKLCTLSIGHNNDNISTVDKGFKAYAQGDDTDFPTIVVKKGDYQFTFSCLNIDTYNFNTEQTKLKITCFCNDPSITNPTNDDEKLIVGDMSFANECYIDTKANARAVISGIIKEYNLKINPITGNKYWAIDISCLGLSIRVVADYRTIDANDLAVGKALVGGMWNTAFLVDDSEFN